MTSAMTRRALVAALATLPVSSSVSGTSLQQAADTAPLSPIKILSPFRNLSEFRRSQDKDDTAACNRTQTDLQAGSKVIYDRELIVSGTINVTRDNFTFEGVNPRASLIRSSALASPIFNVTGKRFRGKELSTIYTGGVPIDGATAFLIVGPYSDLSHITAFNGHRLFAWRSGGHLANSLFGHDWAWSACDLLNANDVYVTTFLFSTSSQKNGQGGALRLWNQVESPNFHGGEFIGGRYGLVTGADTYARGLCPAFGEIEAVKFDNQAEGSLLDATIDMTFVVPWFSGGRSGSGFAGLKLQRSKKPRFFGPRAFACGGNGMTVAATVEDLELHGLLAHANGLSAGAGNARGIEFDANCKDFKVIGGSGGNDLFQSVRGYGSGQQGFNMVINAGCDRFNVIGFGGQNGTLGHIFDGSSSGATKSLTGNFAR